MMLLPVPSSMVRGRSIGIVIGDWVGKDTSKSFGTGCGGGVNSVGMMCVYQNRQRG